MDDGEFLELVSENGRILMRGRSTNPSCISYTHHFDKAQANGGEVIHYRKMPRFLETKLCRDPTIPEGQKSLEIRIPELVRDRNDQISKTFEEGSQSLSPNSNSKQMNSGSYHRNLGLRNFSLFLKSAQLPKPNNNDHQEAARGTSSSGFQELKSKKEDPSAPVLKTASCSNTSEDFHENQNLHQIRQVVYPPKKSPLPDEQSEAPPFHGNAIKSAAAGKFIDQLATATSMCSVGASNDHTSYSLKRRNIEESEEMASRIENVEEEQDSKLVSARTGDKRRRTSEIHNLSERKRRDKINKKMLALQALVPNSNKVDKVSMLDDAIEYLKSLQLQLQIMWMMRSGICMPPVMLASGMQQMQAANLGHLSAMGMGIGMRMPMHPTPFLNSPMIRMLPMAVSSHPPFIPSIGGSSTPSVPAPPISGGPATLVELMASAPFFTSTDGLHSINSEFQDSIQAKEKVAASKLWSTNNINYPSDQNMAIA